MVYNCIMKIVMCYTEGDGCTYSCDQTFCFNYPSAEQALVDFEALLKQSLAEGNPRGFLSQGRFTFADVEFYAHTFIEKGKTYLPEFYTLDEWFTAKSLNG